MSGEVTWDEENLETIIGSVVFHEALQEEPTYVPLGAFESG